MPTGNSFPGCNGTETACDDAQQRPEPRWAECLPHGLYVREGPEETGPDPAEAGPPAGGIQRWSITGRNPAFWWEIVVTDPGTNLGGFEFRCTRCEHRDHAPSLSDVLRLLRAGANLHNTDPAAVRKPPDQ